MSVPADIRAVPRPKNTIVYAYGKNKDRYAVKQRVGCIRKNGHCYPVDGPTIGHIINGKFVPLEEPTSPAVHTSKTVLKDWANVELCYRQSAELMEELLQVYNRQDADKILCMAILRVCYPHIKDCELKESYDESFLTELMPETAMSKNTISTFQKDLGKTCNRILKFMKNRAAKVGIDDHLLIDGTLKSNDSRQNTLSEFSRKARLKGRRDISVLYAFDLEKMEPICSQCFPGNMLDLTSYDSFVKQNGIQSGIMVGDKGFPVKSIEEVLKDCPQLHYFNPLHRNAKLAFDHEMYNFEGVIEGCCGFLGQMEPIQFKKEKLSNKGKWLYSFRDPRRAAQEETDWLDKHRKDKYSFEEYEKKKRTFGTVVFESDVDLSPEDAWKTYSYRWQIEIVMRYYKNALGFDVTRVHDDYSVIGSEFIDFLSTVITFRLLNLFDEKGLLEDMSYKKIMHILQRGKRIKNDNEWELIKMNPGQIEILQKLDLIPRPDPVDQPKRKRGRPRKNPTV